MHLFIAIIMMRDAILVEDFGKADLVDFSLGFIKKVESAIPNAGFDITLARFTIILL